MQHGFFLCITVHEFKSLLAFVFVCWTNLGFYFLLIWTCTFPWSAFPDVRGIEVSRFQVSVTSRANNVKWCRSKYRRLSKQCLRSGYFRIPTTTRCHSSTTCVGVLWMWLLPRTQHSRCPLKRCGMVLLFAVSIAATIWASLKHCRQCCYV